MATRKLGDVAVGEIVKLKENGITENYIVVNQGKPSSIYDNSCSGTWLLRQDCVDRRILDSQDNSIENSELQSWLNSTMLNRFDSDIRSTIIPVKVPYVKGGSHGTLQTGANGLSCKLFLLSAREVGYYTSSYTDDGSKLKYFNENQSVDPKRVAYYEGKAKDWFLRSFEPYYNSIKASVTVSDDGNPLSTYCDSLNGIRFAFVYPNNRVVTDDGYLTSKLNSAPMTPPSITVPEIIRGGEDTSIIWSAATDPDGNLNGYIVERSYNGGSSWAQIYQGRSTSTTTTIPFGTQTVMFRVQAYDTYGEKSG